GGFRGPPTVPAAVPLSFLAAQSGRPAPLQTAQEPAPAWLMATGTAEAMARGGMYDQLGGGFARSSVDREWVVPHFEKMLYDNAQLLRAYVRMSRRPAGTDLADADTHKLLRRVADETADWMLRELRTPEGGFASALDADSTVPYGTSQQGAYYVWTPAQLREELEGEDAAYAEEVFAVTEEGTFEHGASVLQLPETPADPWRYQRVRERLFAARASRPAPARDDKIVAAWNGLAIAGLAEAG